MARGKLHLSAIGVVAISFLTVAGWAIQPAQKTKAPAATPKNFDQQIDANA